MLLDTYNTFHGYLLPFVNTNNGIHLGGRVKDWYSGILLYQYLLHPYQYILPIPTGTDIVKTDISIFNWAYRFYSLSVYIGILVPI